MKRKFTRTGASLATACGLALCLMGANRLSAATFVTVQVDMTAQAKIGRFNLETGSVAVASSPKWGIVFPLTNESAGPNPALFSGTRLDTNNPPGSIVSYLFGYEYPSPAYYQWESPLSTCGSNRTVALPVTDGAHLVLPIVYFDDLPAGVPLVTNDIVFQVDMSVQRSVFGPDTRDSGYLWVYCMGSFNGWNSYSLYLTNNPSASDSNIYRSTLTIVGQPETPRQYRFACCWSQGWDGGLQIIEQPLSTGGANRSFILLPTDGRLVLPVVPFGDLKPSDMLPAVCDVKFSVDMAGAVGTDGHVFDPSTDKVLLNGDFLMFTSEYHGWMPWDLFSLAGLTNAPGSQVYSTTLSLWQLDTVALNYRYSINGQDNEPTGGTNHVRFVRQTGEYILPLDTFGSPVPEPSFGNLTAVLLNPGRVSISWLGRTGVQLQSCADPSASAWQNHPETDGLSSTNWPLADSGRFFRLAKP